jgi:hypothetical protein
MNKKEIHPYLNEGNIKGSTKLILGSFPVYACTDPDNIQINCFCSFCSIN